MNPRTALALVPLAIAACATTSRPGATQPAGRTMPAVAKALINASVDVTFNATVTAFSDAPIETRLVDPDNGVVESPYFDVARYEWRAEQLPTAERLVRLRVTVLPDTLGRGSRVAVYAIYQPNRVAGMTQGRATERSVPSDHPVTAFANKLLSKIEEKATGVRTTTP